MCGIAGIYRRMPVDLFSDRSLSIVEKMLDRIEHRGPDSRGTYEIDNALHGHVRLSLVDLTRMSQQPYLYRDSVLSFNGEIWNFRELREELDEEFETTGDTEVLASLLDRRGLDCLNDLDGMFAFAFSSSDGSHFLVRDRHGKIPIYFTNDNGCIKWASERKAFDAGEVPVPLPPGSVLDLETGDISKWYKMDAAEPLDERSTIDLLRQGVRKRMNLDAEICCLISGGIDSSLILTMAKEVRPDIVAYTAVFDDSSNDLDASRRLCEELQVPLIEVKVEELDITTAIKTIEISSKAQIEIASLCVPLARRISKDGFKACLSGEAADELFGGYGNFCIKASLAQTDEEVFSLRKAQLDKMSRGNFIRCNKAFMSHGVECRLPFMEHELVDRAMQSNLKESPSGKKLLKSAARGIVPEFIIKRQKETFQGSANVSAHQASINKSPIKTYNNEAKNIFGYRPTS